MFICISSSLKYGIEKEDGFIILCSLVDRLWSGYHGEVEVVRCYPHSGTQISNYLLGSPILRGRSEGGGRYRPYQFNTGSSAGLLLVFSSRSGPLPAPCAVHCVITLLRVDGSSPPLVAKTSILFFSRVVHLFSSIIAGAPLRENVTGLHGSFAEPLARQ